MLTCGWTRNEEQVTRQPWLIQAIVIQNLIRREYASKLAPECQEKPGPHRGRTDVRNNGRFLLVRLGMEVRCDTGDPMS